MELDFITRVLGLEFVPSPPAYTTVCGIPYVHPYLPRLVHCRTHTTHQLRRLPQPHQAHLNHQRAGLRCIPGDRIITNGGVAIKFKTDMESVYVTTDMLILISSEDVKSSVVQKGTEFKC